MQKGARRFENYLNQLQLLLHEAEKQKNPGLWLYQHNVRTPLFMLEGLSKLYMELHNKKTFSKLKEQFKQLEDTLGAIDYYDAIAKNFSSNKKIPITLLNYLKAQSREKIQSLNEILTEKKWTGNEKKRILKIQKKLSKVDWLDEDKEMEAIHEFYINAINSIVTFTQTTACHFDNMEADVHELRRKIRWLSIYPQALQGCIQLSKNKKIPAYLNKYLTKEIITSPFNKMPDAGNCHYFLMLDGNHFYALSWMIAKLGNLKDNGLQIIALREALQQTAGMNESEAIKKSYTMLGSKQIKLEKLLLEAANVSQQFFKEQILEKLIIGRTKIQ